jgi:hypothetical protein
VKKGNRLFLNIWSFTEGYSSLCFWPYEVSQKVTSVCVFDHMKFHRRIQQFVFLTIWSFTEGYSSLCFWPYEVSQKVTAVLKSRSWLHKLFYEIFHVKKGNDSYKIIASKLLQPSVKLHMVKNTNYCILLWTFIWSRKGGGDNICFCIISKL